MLFFFSPPLLRERERDLENGEDVVYKKIGKRRERKKLKNKEKKGKLRVKKKNTREYGGKKRVRTR